MSNGQVAVLAYDAVIKQLCGRVTWTQYPGLTWDIEPVRNSEGEVLTPPMFDVKETWDYGPKASFTTRYQVYISVDRVDL